ncbi:obscurin-like protein 1 isoform X5 [Corythoichthys intestinalis]|uniref:obscurin-like protein 1 isoform X5 n=1 Tax=Corythoichthys intestinalis TaxID=161448 RepID=UPI0025A66188|nr:obscurin-like protein 1 isoform X5 [Corythoichthys intestinalis]
MDVFGGAPRFLAYPRQVGVLSGTDAVLKCQIGGDPRPAVIWERNNEKIDPQGRYRVFEDGNVYNLIITGVTIEDSGQYMCKAKNSIGETYAAATLKVEGEAQELELREENKPRFLIKPLSTRAGRGEDAVFSCKLWGSPRPEVTWEKDGRKLSEIFESTHFSVGYQDGGWFQLKIFKTRAPDGGVYTCKARNEFGEALAGAVLLVDAGPGHEEDGNRNGYTNGHRKSHQGKQRIRHMPNQHRADMTTKSTRVKMFAVTEGKHAKFRCFVTGKPKPEIIWRKDGRLILSGRRYLLYEDREGYFTLKVLYCKQKDNGVYVCAASNTAGQTLSAVHLSVKEPPVRFKQPLIDLEVWERDLAVLECEVPEDSVPITWYLEDRRLQPGAKYGMEEWGTKRRLTIRDIGVDDDGIYLCEMPDGGRSIAEVAVKGPIMRKLPRKVDVLEGENAAFCVEVEKEEMDIHWYKDGVELRETHQTILKSFGRTHILVFVNTMPQDSGSVTFFVGRSKTSSQLRVKAAKHCPPSCPVGVQINTERANAALLSWTPAQDSRKNPPSGYVLERQEVGTGSQEWVQCLTTDSATSVEILGDSVPCEADYRFRICSVNKYGKSNNVEFPKAVHLVPVARIQTPLQDALVPEGQDAVFTIELSASVIGSWFLNGTQLQDDERFSMRRSRTHQSLRIQGVRDKENGAEITFVAYGIRDSAALYIQAPLVKFSIMSEMDRNKFVEIGNPIVLYCELSDPAAPVHWYKNGMELQTTDGLHIQSEGTMRRIVIQSAEFSHSGVYCCDAIDDVIRFNVEVEAPSVRFSAIPEAARIKTVHAGSPILLRCELSDRDAQVHWYKDGSKLFPQSGVNIQADGLVRKLVIPSADFYHSGLYSCKTKGDAVTFNVNIKAPPVKFYPLSEEMRTKSIEAGSPLALRCVVSDPDANVCWYKDGIQLVSDSELAIQMDGTTRTLVIQSAELLHSGVYRCTTKDDTMDFQVEIKAKPVMPCNNSEVKRAKSFEMGEPLVLECEVADSTLPAQWYKDGVKLFPHKEQDIQSNGTLRRLIVPSAELVHAGQYNCETSDETIHFTVDMKAPPVTIATPCQTERIESVEVDEPVAQPVVLPHLLATPDEVVTQYKDGIQLHDEAGQDTTVDSSIRALPSAKLSDAGGYSCETTDEAKPFQLDVEVPLQTFSAITETEQKQTVTAGCPVALQCELSEPSGQVTWYKDGTRLPPQTGIDIHSTDNLRSLVIPSTKEAHSGVYRCESKDNDIQFTVEVKALPAKFLELQEADRNKSIQQGCAIVLSCELSQESAVDWYKDGVKLQQQSNLELQKEGRKRTLFIPSAETTHSGMFECATADDAVTFKVDVKGRLPHITPVPESEKHKMIAAGSPIILQCEVSDRVAQVSWFKDEVDLFCKTGLDMKRDGSLRKLIIHSAKTSDSGLYGCKLAEDVVTFHVDVQAAPVKFAAIPDEERNKLVETGCPVKMQCEVSEPTAQVQWQKDGGQLLPKTDFEIQNEETLRALVIKAAEVRHSGVYSCDSADDHIEFKVDVAAVPEVTAKQAAQAGDKEKMQCKGSDSTGLPGLHEDGIKHFPQSATQIDSEGHRRTPELDSAVSVLPVSGEYGCKSDDDSESNDCYAEVKAPPITFADILEEELFKSVVEKSQLRLSCEVSRDDAVVQWYKDGAEIQPSANITIQAEATMRHLAIESAQLVDSGIYTCRAGDNAVVFKVNIREPPVMIVFPKEDVHLDRHVPDEIILSCELSRPNGVVSWYKDGQKLQKSENIKLKVEGPYRRLKILKSGVEDSGEYVCDTADDSIFFNLTITEPPVRIVSPSQSQMELCQQTSERMVLSCEISRPNAVVRWYRDGLEVEESDNLILEVDGVYRRLIIPETTVKDSAEYVCDTTDESMTFFVNIAEPPVRFVRRRKTVNILEKIVNETLVLDCEVSRPNAVVFWKRNGEEVEDSKNVTIVEDGVARQLTVHSLALADAGLYICDAKDDVMDFHVKVKDVPVQIIGKTNAKTEKQFLVSDDIILVCELSRPNAAVNWYKDNQPIDNTERYCSEEQGVFRSLVVLSASLEDSGEYSCDAGDDKMVFHITVAEPPVRIVGNSGHPEHHILLTGEELILECEVSRSNATVQWLWNGDILKPDTRVKIYSHDVMRKLVLSGLQLSDSGKYVCDAGDDKLITIVEVQELPVKFLNKKATNKILAYENESATLCAIVSRDKANVRWLKDGQLLNKDNIHISSEGNTHKLTINPLQLSDSGDYVCDANTDDMHFSLFVKEMKVKFIRRLENMVSLKGKSLTLRCEINKPKGDVQWVKDGLEISPSRRHRIRAQGRERSFTIFDVLEEDAGEYACESTDDRTSATLTVNTPRVVEFIAELRNITVCEGEDAVFKCVVSPADAQFMWRLNGKQVALNERTVVSSSGLCHMLCIRNCMVSDSGIVTADAEGLISKCELQVQERQVVFTKKMLPVTAEELGEATLEVEVSLQSKEVQWMRQGVLIHPGAKYTLKQKGPKHSLTIHKLAMSDRGTYSCETLHDCTQAQLTVEPRKITIKKGLSDIKTMDRETATFEVELSHPNVSGTWWKNGNQLKLTSHFRMTAKANVHSLTISNLSVEDTATYMFCVEKLKTSARLVVKEPPVTIFRKLEDQKFPEGSVISIECELSRHNVDVKWMKNGSEVKPGKNVRIHAIGRKRFLQITKCIVSDSGMYTCDAGDVATSGTVEVYERELLVIQGLEDLNIAEDQNAVFVCEISVEDVPGEWYKNGAMIHPTSTIKTRQEGTKHFLLMCNVRPEDSGEIKFVARHLTSVAKLQVKEIPLSIVKPLQDKTALEKTRVMLDCTVSNPRCSIRWYKGSNVILPSERFEISSEGCYRKLIIQQVVLDDAGTYSMQVGQYTCSAKLTVEAQTVLMVRELQDVEVTAPGEACLECEVSVPVQKRPTWSLNGETLHPSAQVRLEKLGTVHKLILRQTSTGMSGVVCFACGKAKSSAQLRVLSNP